MRSPLIVVVDEESAQDMRAHSGSYLECTVNLPDSEAAEAVAQATGTGQPVILAAGRVRFPALVLSVSTEEPSMRVLI